MGELILGYHINKGSFKTYAQACEHARDVVRKYMPQPAVSPCAAIFSSGPRNVRANLTTGKPEMEALAEFANRARDMYFLMHASYLDLLWTSGAPSLACTARVAKASRTIGTIQNARLVVHSTREFFASRETTEQVYVRIAETLGAGVHAPILMETMSHLREFASTRAINRALDDMREIIPCAGICIDTAHIWAAGADIATRASCADWLDGITRSVPVAMHLNDSTQPIGTGRDIHATLGAGEIWALEDGYMSAIEWARSRGAYVILERTHDQEVEAIKDLKMLSRKLN